MTAQVGLNKYSIDGLDVLGLKKTSSKSCETLLLFSGVNVACFLSRRTLRRGGGLITSSRSTKDGIYLFTFSRFSKIEVVQNVKNVTLVPFCKTECFDHIVAS